MSLNIKNPIAEEKIRKLAAMRGVSLVTAVMAAVDNEIEREEEAKKQQSRLEWLDELTKWTAPLLKDLPPSDKIGDLLYDKETGLPL
jgi:hypothetical protein